MINFQQTTLKSAFGSLNNVPQMWCVYKEVGGYYQAGMKVPDDVTILTGLSRPDDGIRAVGETGLDADNQRARIVRRDVAVAEVDPLSIDVVNLGGGEARLEVLGEPELYCCRRGCE